MLCVVGVVGAEVEELEDDEELEVDAGIAIAVGHVSTSLGIAPWQGRDKDLHGKIAIKTSMATPLHGSTARSR